MNKQSELGGKTLVYILQHYVKNIIIILFNITY